MSSPAGGPTTALTAGQLSAPLAAAIQLFARQTFGLAESEPFDEARADYLHAQMQETLVAHANAATKCEARGASTAKLQKQCAEELAQAVQMSMDEELEERFGTDPDAPLRVQAIGVLATSLIELACGRGTVAKPSVPPPSSTPRASDATASSSAAAASSNASVVAGSSAVPSTPAVSIEPLVGALCEIFPAFPPVQVEATLMACGAAMNPEAALDLAGEVLAQCSPPEDQSDSDPWPAMLRALGPDEKAVYRHHLQLLKYKQAALADQTQQQFYDRDNVTLKRQTSSSSTGSGDGTSAPRDAYYSSPEFLAAKQRLASQWTYDTSKKDTFHKPHVKFESRPKHHARFLDGQIVNTRGEKITIIRDEAEIAREAEWRATHKPLKVITKKKGGVGHKYV